MISSVEIKGFRGIREGKVDDLTPLVILVGPNGCGKSTILDALLIGAGPDIADVVGQAVVRHQGLKTGAQWTLWRSEEHGRAEIVVTTPGKMTRTCRLRVVASEPCKIYYEASIGRSEGKREPSVRRLLKGMVQVEPDRHIFSTDLLPLQDVPQLRIVESPSERTRIRLHKLLTQCIKQGRRSDVKAAIAEVVPNVKDILILTEGDSPIVHLEYTDHSVPAALAGDGIYSLLLVALELLSTADGVVLLEEPEVHQHPGAIRQTVRAILAAVRRGIQVVLTTHSLELIDAILAESSEEDVERLSLYRLELEDGSLISHRIPGSEVEFARTEVEKDLR